MPKHKNNMEMKDRILKLIRWDQLDEAGKSLYRKGLFYFSFYLMAVYLGWRLFFTIPFDRGWISIIAGVSLLFVEIFGFVESLVHFSNALNHREHPLPQIEDDEFPHVDVFIATYNEDPELLYKTVNGCRNMKYPDKEKVHIYLCDDNRRPHIRKLAEEMGVGYFDRPNNRGAKAGNLNEAMRRTDSPFIVTFDADMIPRSDFLLKTIPYFVESEKINSKYNMFDQIPLGLLQTPQAFYNPDLFQYNPYSEERIPNEQDYFYRNIQSARTRTNTVIYGGSNTILSRKALEGIGGFYEKAITEDFATGLLLEKNGFVSLGIGEPMAAGLSPTDLPSLVQQRVRWGRGVINTVRNMHIFTDKDLSMGQKMNYLISLWYWYFPIKRLIYFLSPILFAVFGHEVILCTLPEILLFWAPAYFTINVAMKMLSGNTRSVKWTGIYEMIMFPMLLIPLTLETLGISMKTFKVTSKNRDGKDKPAYPQYMLPFIVMLVLCSIGIYNCLKMILVHKILAPAVVLFWLITNLFEIIMSIFFMDGRSSKRGCDRFKRDLPVNIRDQANIISGHTIDISESGLAVLSENLHHFEQNREYEIRLSSDFGPIVIMAKPVYVKKVQEGWRWAFTIESFRENTYDNFLGMLYDVDLSGPKALKREPGILADIWVNFISRIRPIRKAKEDSITHTMQHGTSVTCVSNYRHEAISMLEFRWKDLTLPARRADRIQISIQHQGEEIRLRCRYEKHLKKRQARYTIENLEEIFADASKSEALKNYLMVFAC